MELVKPKIYGFDCADIEGIDQWIPDNPLNVDFWMNFSIGIGGPGSDDFQVHVMTHRALHDHKGKKEFSIVLKEYTWENLMAAVDSICEQCSGYDWQEISDKLSKRLAWEYKDYRG